MTDAATRETAPRNRQGYVRYIRKSPRSIAETLRPSNISIAGQAMSWLLPWSVSDYPGIGRGITQMLGNSAPVGTVWHWRYGTRTMPQWARDILAACIRQRLEAGHAVLAALEADWVPERRHTGVCSVDPVTGRDGRNRTGQRRAKPVP